MRNRFLKFCTYAALILSFFIIPFKTLTQWVEQNSNSSYFLTSVYFLNENTGLLGTSFPPPFNSNFVGGEIIRTTDSGINWQRVLLDSNLRVKSFYFIDQNTGYAIGGTYVSSGKLIKTTDSGIHWETVIDYQTPGYEHFYNMYFANSVTGFLSYYHGIFRTTNSGINWNSELYVNDYAGGELSYKKIHYFDINTGIFLSDSGKVYKTTNSGNNWQVYYVNSSIVFRDIAFINNSTGYAVGLEGKMIKTTDAGETWNEVFMNTNESFFSIKFANSLVGYLTKDKGVLKTTDGGLTWQEVMQLNTDSLLAVYFLNPDVGYVSGTKGRVFKTTTGGVIGITQINTEVPKAYLLDQNYPNPFNPNTKIKFALPKSAFVNLAVYDLLGRKIDELVNSGLTAGAYEVNWNAEKYSSGIYLYKINTDDFQMVKKMSLIK